MRWKEWEKKLLLILLSSLSFSSSFVLFSFSLSLLSFFLTLSESSSPSNSSPLSCLLFYHLVNNIFSSVLLTCLSLSLFLSLPPPFHLSISIPVRSCILFPHRSMNKPKKGRNGNKIHSHSLQGKRCYYNWELKSRFTPFSPSLSFSLPLFLSFSSFLLLSLSILCSHSHS